MFDINVIVFCCFLLGCFVNFSIIYYVKFNLLIEYIDLFWNKFRLFRIRNFRFRNRWGWFFFIIWCDVGNESYRWFVM